MSRIVDPRGRAGLVEGTAAAADVDPDESGLTNARTRAQRETHVDEPARGVDPIRRWVAIGAAAVALVVLGIGIVVFGGGDDDGADEPPVTEAPPPPDTFFELLAPPSDVAVVALGEGRYEVSFEIDDAVPRVEVEVVGTGERQRPVTAEQSPVVVTSVAGSVCVVVRSIGDRGRVSAAVGPVCSR